MKMNLPKNRHKENVFDKIARQKQEMLRNIRHEKKLMAQYGNELLRPLQQPQELLTANPLKQITRTVSTATYAFKIAKSIISVIKYLR